MFIPIQQAVDLANEYNEYLSEYNLDNLTPLIKDYFNDEIDDIFEGGKFDISVDYNLIILEDSLVQGVLPPSVDTRLLKPELTVRIIVGDSQENTCAIVGGLFLDELRFYISTAHGDTGVLETRLASDLISSHYEDMYDMMCEMQQALRFEATLDNYSLPNWLHGIRMSGMLDFESFIDRKMRGENEDHDEYDFVSPDDATLNSDEEYIDDSDDSLSSFNSYLDSL
jgi:hypothetical protein